MTNIKPLIKRIGAYIIDLFIVLALGTLISSIPLFEKSMKDYQKIYNEYLVEYDEYSKYLLSLEDAYKDEEITEEEYNELIEVDTYNGFIISKYEDSKISKGEYNEIFKEINTQFDEVVKDYNYIFAKKGITNSIVTYTITLLYFGVIQYFLKGQTIGKKILKIQVVSASDKKINILHFILRTLIVNEVLLNVIKIIFLATTTKNVYMKADSTISLIISVVEAVIIFLVITREDQRGLHDLISNTKVVALEKQPEETKEEKTSTVKKTLTNKSNAKKNNSKKKIINAEYKERDN